MTSPMAEILLRPSRPDDLEALVALEQRCFTIDKLSRRSLRRWLSSDHAALVVAERNRQLLGYVLVILHRGTRLARLYSIAVDSASRGGGLGLALLQAGENAALDAGRVDMRLEVRPDNGAAIRLYEQQGYRRFGEYDDYYEDHSPALRYQKRIRQFAPSHWQRDMPWYRQTTEFTCGPASLMMAMRAQDKGYRFNREEELRLWREATTIYMTSGHGGCHPLGLALAATQRGFNAEVWISHRQPLFVDSVRNEEKRAVIETVHRDFVRAARQSGIAMHYDELSQADLEQALKSGGIPVVLISTWQMDRKRAPHWVVICAIDEQFIYLHDPDPDEEFQTELDCQYMPIARTDFERMARFGKDRLRTAVIIRKP